MSREWIEALLKLKPKLEAYSNHNPDLSRDIKAIQIPASYASWTARPVDDRAIPSARIVKWWYGSPFPIAMLHLAAVPSEGLNDWESS